MTNVTRKQTTRRSVLTAIISLPAMAAAITGASLRRTAAAITGVEVYARTPDVIRQPELQSVLDDFTSIEGKLRAIGNEQCRDDRLRVAQIYLTAAISEMKKTARILEASR